MSRWPAPNRPGGQRGGSSYSPRSRTSATGAVAGLAMVVCGSGLLVSAAVDLVGERAHAHRLGIIGAIALGTGLTLRRTLPMPARVPPRIALRSVLVAALSMIAVSSVAYLSTGTVSRVDDALFESTAGFTTTALTVLPDLESVDQGILFWRALTQWLGGFFALATIVAVLPFLGVGGPRPTGAVAPLGAKHLLSPHVRQVLRRYFQLYVGLTGFGALLFLVGGMGPFDAATYSFTTISTGGFANHDRSFAHFGSPLLEWVGFAGMLLGGLSLPLAWQVLRGRPGNVLRSAELRVYLGLIVGTTFVLSFTEEAGRTLHDSIRISAFSAASAVSTTGFWVDDWTDWGPGPQMLLLVVIGVGAMSGSMGGGFRIIRAMALVSYVERELMRQLVPRSVRTVRVGRNVIDEQTAGRMIGYQVLFIGTAVVGALALTLTGDDLLTALSGTISALSTFGPALGDLAPGTHLLTRHRWTLLVLMGLMLAGRLELYPVLSTASRIVTWPLREVERRYRASAAARRPITGS